MKSTMRRSLAFAISLASATALVVGGFAIPASAADESPQSSIETVATEPAAPIVEPAPAEVVTPDPASSEIVVPDPEPVEAEPIETAPEEAPAEEPVETPVSEPAPPDTVTPDPASSEIVVPEPEAQPVETVATGEQPAKTSPTDVEPAGPVLVEKPTETPVVVVPQASIANFSAVAICVDETNSRPGTRASVDVVVPDGAAPAVVQLTMTAKSDGASGPFSDPRTFVTSGTLTKVNAMSEGGYSIEVQLNGTEVGSIDVLVTKDLCDPEPTPVVTVENFSAKAVCIDPTHERQPGIAVFADVVVPEGASSALVAVLVDGKSLGSETFNESGQLKYDFGLPVGEHVVEVTVDGVVKNKATVSIPADVCSVPNPDPTPTDPPAPEPPVVPAPEPSPVPAPEPTHTDPPVVIDNGWGSNPPAESVSDDSDIQSLPNTGMNPSSSLGFGLLALLVGAGTIVITRLRRKSATAK